MSERLKALNLEWHGCTRCSLSQERPCANIVFGAGAPNAKYLLVYETPTAGDVEQARPFTRKEGYLLQDLLNHAKVDHGDVFCTPLVGCRPTLFQPATADQEERLLDREPTKEELAACWPRLEQILYRVDPLIVFAFGALAMKVLVNPKDRSRVPSHDKAIGDLFLTRVPGHLMQEVTYDVMPLLGIKKILANPSSAAHGTLATTARHLHKGARYAAFIEETGQRDAKAAGIRPEGA